MNPEAIANPDLKTQVELEAKNLKVIMNQLGDGVGLIDNFGELYQSLIRFVVLPDGGIATGRAKISILALHMLMKARANLLIGAATLLRGYRANSLLYLRGAIEAVAFAAHVRRNPDLADVWLNSVADCDAYKKYKRKFKNVFPADDTALQPLYERYDFCSRSIHSSPYAIAGNLDYPAAESEMVINFKLFDLPEDQAATTLCVVLDTHRLILRKFAQALQEEISANVAVWEVRLNSAEAALEFHKSTWQAAAT